MAQTTTHTQTQQNATAADADLEPGTGLADVGRGDDAELYKNSEGAQTGGTRAFNANAGDDNLPNALDERNGLSGNDPSRLPHDGSAGITNHPDEERERQQKVINS